MFMICVRMHSSDLSTVPYAHRVDNNLAAYGPTVGLCTHAMPPHRYQ